MKTCYNCFHMAEDSHNNCENCGFPLNYQNEHMYPDALPCGMTLYGRYQMGKVLVQDDTSITYIAQDSRTKGLVAIREYFPKSCSKRTSQHLLYVPEEARDTFREGKDLFLREAEKLSEEADSDRPPCVQSWFGQNDTSYLVVDYGTPEDLEYFLAWKGFRHTDTQGMPDHAYEPQVHEATVPAAHVFEPQAHETPAPVAHVFEPQVHETPAPAAHVYKQSSLENAPEVHTQELQVQEAPAPAADVHRQSSLANTPAADLPPGFHNSLGGSPAASRDASVRPASGRGKKSSVLPVAVILGLTAAIIIALMLVLPRVISGFREIRQSIHSLQDKDEDKGKEEEKRIEKEKKKTDNDNPIKKFFGGGNQGGNSGGISQEINITSGNYFNKGYYTLIDDTCYFADSTGLHRANPKELDNSELIQTGKALYLNEYDGNLFYLAEHKGEIVCYNPDDGSSSVIYDYYDDPDYAPQTVFIYDDWCYFSNENNLFRFNLTETDKNTTLYPSDVEHVLEDFNSNNMIFPSLCFLNGQLVYNGTDGITSVVPDIPSPKTISEREGSFFTDGTNLYCQFGTHRIYRIDMDGNSEVFLDTDTSGMITSVNCAGDWLYYTVSDKNAELYRISKDGKTTEFVSRVGNDGSMVISLCTFPDSEYIFIYMLTNETDTIKSMHKVVRVD